MISLRLIACGIALLGLVRCGVMGPPTNYVDRADRRKPAGAQAQTAEEATPAPAEASAHEESE
jgi:hypothetical protein